MKADDRFCKYSVVERRARRSGPQGLEQFLDNRTDTQQGGRIRRWLKREYKLMKPELFQNLMQSLDCFTKLSNEYGVELAKTLIHETIDEGDLQIKPNTVYQLHLLVMNTAIRLNE